MPSEGNTMTRILSLIGITILLLSTSPLATAAVTLPPAPPETPAARAFQLAGFTQSAIGCRVSTPAFTASSSVGDAEMKSLIDPGVEMALDLSKSHVSAAGINEVAKFSKLFRLRLTGSGITLADLAGLDTSHVLSVELDAAQITVDSARYLAAHAKPTCCLNVEQMNDAVVRALGEVHLLHLLWGARGLKNLPCRRPTRPSMRWSCNPRELPMHR